jgi:hypothetical protein
MKRFRIGNAAKEGDMIVDVDDFVRCVGCNCKLPTFRMKRYPNHKIDFRPFCRACGTKPVRIKFYAFSDDLEEEFELNLQNHLSFGELMDLDIPLIRTMKQYMCCKKGNTEEVDRDTVLCDGDEFMLVPREKDFLYNHSCQESRSIVVYPSEIGAEIQRSTIDENGIYWCYCNVLNCGKTLDRYLRKPKTLEADQCQSVFNCITMLAGDNNNDYVAPENIVILKKTQFRILPFVPSESKTTNMLVEEILATKGLPRNLRRRLNSFLKRKNLRRSQQEYTANIERAIAENQKELRRLAGDVVLDDYDLAGLETD